MKKLLLILLCLPVILFSQTSGGPDGYGYTWVDSNDPQGPIYDWVDIEVPANLVSGLGDDNIIGSFPIESFNFYWYNVTSLSCLLYTSPSPRDGLLSRMPSSA